MLNQPEALSRPKPRLRGVSHQFAAFVAMPAVVALWAGAGTFAARLGAGVYGTCLLALFTISAAYHRPTWSPGVRDLIGRIDQSAIFLFIAGTFTPFGLLFGPGGRFTVLAVVWAGALGGVIIALAWPGAPKIVMAGIYVLFAWALTGVVPMLHHVVGPSVLGLVVAGGVVYTTGAVVYALRRPDPLPRVFGYHEIFHLFVVAAAALHFAAVWMALRLLP
jgi:hemolysin III